MTNNEKAEHIRQRLNQSIDDIDLNRLEYSDEVGAILIRIQKSSLRTQREIDSQMLQINVESIAVCVTQDLFETILTFGLAYGSAGLSMDTDRFLAEVVASLRASPPIDKN